MELEGRGVIFRYKGLSEEPYEFLEVLKKDIMQYMNNGLSIGILSVLDRDSGVYTCNHLRLNSEGEVVFNFYDTSKNGQDRSKSRLEDLAKRRGFEIEIVKA